MRRRLLGLLSTVIVAAGTIGPAPAHMAELRELVLRPGTLTLGLGLAGRPLSYRQDGVVAGFEVELARAVAESALLTLDVVTLPRDGLMEALAARRVDLIATGALADPAPTGLAVVPYLNVGDHMLVLRGNPFRVRGTDDLSGGIVSVTMGSTAEKFAREINRRFVADGRAPVHIHSFPHQRFTPFPVIMGHAQAYFVPTATALIAARDPAGKAMLVEGAFRATHEVGFGVRAEDRDMVEALRHGIARMISSGTYDRLRAAHGLPAELSPYR
jgi:ABC-type amino acid transport substrate-binding protein